MDQKSQEALDLLAREYALFEKKIEFKVESRFKSQFKELLGWITRQNEPFYVELNGNWIQLIPADYSISFQGKNKGYLFQFYGKYLATPFPSEKPGEGMRATNFLEFRILPKELDKGNIGFTVEFSTPHNIIAWDNDKFKREYFINLPLLTVVALISDCVAHQRMKNSSRFHESKPQAPREAQGKPKTPQEEAGILGRLRPIFEEIAKKTHVYKPEQGVTEKIRTSIPDKVEHGEFLVQLQVQRNSDMATIINFHFHLSEKEAPHFYVYVDNFQPKVKTEKEKVYIDLTGSQDALRERIVRGYDLALKEFFLFLVFKNNRSTSGKEERTGSTLQEAVAHQSTGHASLADIERLRDRVKPFFYEIVKRGNEIFQNSDPASEVVGPFFSQPLAGRQFYVEININNRGGKVYSYYFHFELAMSGLFTLTTYAYHYVSRTRIANFTFTGRIDYSDAELELFLKTAYAKLHDDIQKAMRNYRRM
ncbi:MAG: hypothetical protein V1743_04360 [Nanoarchaeota archaeon]